MTMFFSCSLCAKPVEVTRDVWLDNGAAYCGPCGSTLRKPVVFGAEELHLLGDRYGWDARLGDVIVGETSRRVDLKLESEKAASAGTPAAQEENP